MNLYHLPCSVEVGTTSPRGPWLKEVQQSLMGHPITVARHYLANLHPMQKRPAISHYLNARQHEWPHRQLSGKLEQWMVF